MLAELVGQDGRVEPVESELTAVDQFDQRVQYFRLLAHLVAEAEVLPALDEAQRLHLRARASPGHSSHEASLRFPRARSSLPARGRETSLRTNDTPVPQIGSPRAGIYGPPDLPDKTIAPAGLPAPPHRPQQVAGERLVNERAVAIHADQVFLGAHGADGIVAPLGVVEQRLAHGAVGGVKD